MRAWCRRIGTRSSKKKLRRTRKSAVTVPVIRQLGERLELLRLSQPQAGPIFRNSLGNPLSMKNVLTRVILPALNRCAHCGESRGLPHVKADHVYQPDARLFRC